MQYRVLGRTGLRVSCVALGTATFGVAPDPHQAQELVHASLDAGITFFDTADVYGHDPVFDRPGAPAAHRRQPAEQILGAALRGRRDQVVITSKSCGITGPGVNDRGLSRRHILTQVEESLRRLSTDWIDVYYAHDPDPHTPLEQTLAVCDDLVMQGKIRYVALSNHPAWQLTRALWIAEKRHLASAPVAVEVKYNLLERAAERELAPACDQLGVSLLAYAPLHGGLLGDPAIAGRVVAGDQRFGAAGFTPAEAAEAGRVRQLASGWGMPMAHASLAWLLSRPAVTSVVTGPETVAELHAVTSAADIHLEEVQLQALTALAPEPAAFHHRAGTGPRQPQLSAPVQHR